MCSIAEALYDQVSDLPIISPHGHCNPKWFATNDKFTDPAQLLGVPDHYIYRMLLAKGPLEDLGGNPILDLIMKKILSKFGKLGRHYYLFRGTPTSMWLDYAFEKAGELNL